MNYDNFIKFLKAYPRTRELQFMGVSTGSRYRSFNIRSKHILQFPEESGVGTMILHSMVDIHKVHQLEYYKDLAKELKIENAQGLYESITFNSCKKDKMGKVDLNTTSQKWLSKMLQFVVNNYVELKYNNTKSPRRNSKQFKDKLCWAGSSRVAKRAEHKDFKNLFDLTTSMYMVIVNKRCDPALAALSKSDKKFLLSQIESCLTKVNEMGGV